MSAGPKTILIVEDSPVQAELLRRTLEAAGYNVIAAGNGAEGLALAKAHHPAAVVSDINMPVMDGYALCHAIRQDDGLKLTPVILLTMLSDPQDVIGGLNAGADAYVTKPYNVRSLIGRIELLLAYPPLPPPPVERRKLEVHLGGDTHLVDAHSPRMLNLLISTYENAVLQNRELVATQQALEDLNQHLEEKVLEKTAELRESELRFRALIENASDLVLVIDASGVITYVSPSVKRVGGYAPDDLLGKSVTAFLHPDDLPTALADISALVHNPGKLQTSELRYRGKNGDVIILETIGKSAIDDPAINGIVINARDITERKRAEDGLRESEARFRTLAEVSPTGIFRSDAKGDLLYVNRRWCELAGLAESEASGRSWILAIHPDDRERVVEAWYRAAREAAPYQGEARFQHATGRTIWHLVDAAAATDASGKVSGYVGTVTDITERKRSEEELRRLNWALRALGQSNSALVHAGTETQLFQACCDAIAGSEGYPLAWIGFAIDDAAHSVLIASAAGAAVGHVQDLEASWDDASPGAGPAGTAMRTGSTQVANNLAESGRHPAWIERARALGLASAIALPIRANGDVLGALKIYSREADAFGRAEVELFEELAADIGYGIVSRRTLSERDSLQRDQRLGAERLKNALIGTIGAVALTVEKRDPYTAGHQQRVAELCVAIGRMLDFSEDRLEGLRLGATIHDLGKIYVPSEILSRPGKLSGPEFEIIKSHPQVGYDIVKEVKFPWPVSDMILQHHERLDGSGYPNGLKGDAIILEARILAVADVLEAMSSHRPYRPGFGIDAALAQIRQEAGTKLDTQAVDACERLFRERGFSFAKS